MYFCVFPIQFLSTMPIMRFATSASFWVIWYANAFNEIVQAMRPARMTFFIILNL
ncbi:MAG: hypothetical protein ACD_2C00153G0001 [uncultured bacterium (gcode 4)]|uniref:Uncharacterized protein n=1 Tax=uncultured bacterium (gcode 4) TaxID=1234023 RepID=K2H109_9BACT|nr:MAG: hypothetical protein ACD_2C00153G0001 [uncultured bacterium (gcode 4)]